MTARARNIRLRVGNTPANAKYVGELPVAKEQQHVSVFQD
jgi:hypothetical protein